jgi:outer membrane protein TolC
MLGLSGCHGIPRSERDACSLWHPNINNIGSKKLETVSPSVSKTNSQVCLVSFHKQDEQLAEPTASKQPTQGIDYPSSLDKKLENQINAARSVDDYLQLALNSHPKLLAARARVSAAQQRIPQATALPDPMAESMFWPIQSNSLQTAGGRMQNQLGISQEIPFREKRWTKGDIAQREVGMALAETEKVEREIVEGVRLAYFELWFANRAIEITKENRDLADRLVKVAEARYKTGGSQQDVLRAELEVEKLAQQILLLQQQKGVAQADLSAWIQLPTESVLETESTLPTQDIPAQLDALIAEAERCNPELHALAWQIQRDMQQQRLASLQRYPDLRLGTQYGMMATGGAISPVADGNDMISFSVGVTLPIWREKIRAGICEASAQRVSSIRQLEAEHLSISGKLRRLLAEAGSLEQQRELYVSRITPKAEQALQIAMSEYTVGKTTFVQLVDNYAEVLMFQLQTARLEATLAGTLAQIERTVGCQTQIPNNVAPPSHRVD